MNEQGTAAKKFLNVPDVPKLHLSSLLCIFANTRRHMVVPKCSGENHNRSFTNETM